MFSAITKDGVEVVITALEEALTDVTVEVKDDKGNVVAVKPANFVKGETLATFEFVAKLGVDPTGVWTVEGKTIDLDLAKNLDDLYTATNEVATYNALNKLGLTDVKAENVTFYKAQLDKVTDDTDEKNYVAQEDFTVENAQAIVTAGNKAATAATGYEAVVKSVNEATNQVALLNILSENFERVNAEWIDTYEGSIPASVPETKAGFESIQDAINDDNDAAVNAADGALTGAARTKAKVQELVTLATAYFTPDEDDVTAKADLLNNLNIDLAIMDVNAAKTPAQLTSAVNALKQLDVAFELDMTEYKDANRAAYIEYFASLGNAATDIASVTTAFTTVNATQAGAVFTNLNTVANTPGVTADNLLKAIKATGAKNVIDANKAVYLTNVDTAFDSVTYKNADDLTKVQALVNAGNLATVKANVVATDDNKAEFMDLLVKSGVYKDVSTSNKAQYVVASLFSGVTAETTIASIPTQIAANQTIIDTANVTAVKAATASGAQLLSKLNLIADVAKEVKAEYAAAYLASAKDSSTSGAIGHSGVATKADLLQAIKDVNEAQVTAQGLKDLNNAKTASELNDILVDLILDGAIKGNDDYLDLSTADKLLVAELFLNDNTFDQTSDTKLVAARDGYDKIKGEYTKLDKTAPDGTEGAAKDLAAIVTAVDVILTDITDEFNDGTAVAVGAVKASDVQPALADLVKVGYTAYDELSGANKVKVAQTFIANYPTNADGNEYVVGYTSITALTNAIDNAIAAQ